MLTDPSLMFLSNIHNSGYKPLPFIVMEELQQLPKYVNMRGPEHARLSFEQVLQLAKDLSDALFYLHEQVCVVSHPSHQDIATLYQPILS